MPRYSKNRKRKLVRKQKGFEHPYQIIHFLSTASEKDMKPFRDTARSYVEGEKQPPIPLKRKALKRIATLHPKKLVKHVVADFQGNDAVGGGIGSAIGAISHVAGNMIGLPFGAQKPQALTLDQETAAYLVKMAYKPIDERPDTVLKRYERLSEFDSKHIAVYKDNRTGELTVACRGTKMNWSNIKDDIGILAGKTSVDSQEIDGVLDRLEKEFPGMKYNVAAHSLGTMFIETQRPEHGAYYDNVYMFNPASSPMQSDDFEQLYANNPQYQYFINHGDLVSSNLLQFMTPDTLENSVNFGSYAWSPVTAHSLSNWYPEGFGNADGDPIALTEQKPSDDTAELQQDNEQTQQDNLS
jgi:hypothetical protein